MYLKAPIY